MGAWEGWWGSLGVVGVGVGGGKADEKVLVKGKRRTV